MLLINTIISMISQTAFSMTMRTTMISKKERGRYIKRDERKERERETEKEGKNMTYKYERK